MNSGQKRTEEELRRRTKGLTTLLDVSRNLAATLNLETVLQATTDGVAKLSGLDTSAVYLLEGETLRLEATTPPLPLQFPEELRNAPLRDHPHIARSLASKRSVIVPDTQSADLTAAERSAAEQRDLRTVIYIPLIADEKAIGALIVGAMKAPLNVMADEIDLCQTLANLAALTVENALLFRSRQQYAAELEKNIIDREKDEQERLELERRLLHAQKLESLGILAGGIAHDFNNLLMAIMGNLDIALLKIAQTSPIRSNIEQSVQAALRATDLTRQMLAYSGRGRFVVDALDLSDLVEENARLFRSSIARTAALELHLSRSLPLFEADAGQIQQVVMNLLMNASEALDGKPGTITVSTGTQQCDEHCLRRSRAETLSPAGTFLFLEVADTGCGMDERTQEHLFDPFFTTKSGGRGLGMSAILGIVRGHEGAIFVDSGPGKGTAIRILFPPAAEAPSEIRSFMAPAAAGSCLTAPGGTILVVDDEEFVLDVCREMIQAIGMKVLTAADGQVAVDLFRKNTDRISCVLLDLSMPRMDGMTAMEELQRIKPGIKIILSSGYDEQDSIKRLSRKGLAGFIQKPYTLENLRKALTSGRGASNENT